METNKLHQGIWEILKKFQTKEFDITSDGYKQYYTVVQLIEKLKNNENFCIGYTKTEGCSTPNCVKMNSKKEFFQPLINFNDEYITQYSIDNLLDYLFSPQNSYCLNCQWDNGKIVKIGNPKYFKTFTDLIIPKFMFISFESDLNVVFEVMKDCNNSKISKSYNII